MQTTTEVQGRGTGPTKTTGSAWRSPLVIGLAALLVLQILVALGLGVGREMNRGSSESAGPLLAFDPEQVTGIRVRTPDGEPVRVAKTEDGWVIPSLADLPAAEHKVTALLTKLEGLQKGLPVATSEAALKRFKVAADAFECKLILESGDAPPATLYLGDSPGFRRLFVRAEDDGAIYEAELGLFDAPDRPDNWSDRTLLHLDKEDLQRLTFAGLTLERTDDGWRLTDLAAGEEQDQQAIEDRVRALANIGFLGVLGGEEEPALSTEATPLEIEATLTDGDTIRYRITKLADSDDYLLQVSNRPQDFTLASYEVEDLTDLRRADLLKKPGEAAEEPSTGSPAATGDEDAKPAAETTTLPADQAQETGETASPDSSDRD